MRAVNLIPADARPGGSGLAGRSGGAVYVILGGLAALVVMVALWAMAGSTISKDHATVARLHSETATAQAAAGKDTAGDDLRAQRDQQLATVKALAAARTDWASTLDAIARTLPADTWLDTMDASIAPGAGPAGGTGNAGAVASSVPAPSIHISGCSPSQAKVALLMPRLRTIPGVNDVTLVNATRASETSGASTTTGGCQHVTFEMVLFFTPPAGTPAPATPGAPGTTASAAPATTPAATTTPPATTPAATTTPAPTAVPASAPTTGSGG